MTHEYCIETLAILGYVTAPAAVQYNWVPYVTARTYGDPYYCYDAEGGYAEDVRYVADVGPSPGRAMNPVELDEREAAELDVWLSDDTLGEHAEGIEEARRYGL